MRSPILTVGRGGRQETSRSAIRDPGRSGLVVGTLSPTVTGASPQDTEMQKNKGHVHTHTCTQSSQQHCSQWPTAEITQMSTNYNSKTHPYSEILSDNRNEALTRYNTEEPSRHDNQGMRPVTKGYDPLLRNVQKRQTHRQEVD